MVATGCLILPNVAMSQVAVSHVEATPLYKVCKAVTPPDEDADIIFEVPDGEVRFFSRSCTEYKNDYEGLQRNDIKGSAVRQVRADDGKLYFSNPLSDFILLSYLKGSYDADGSIVIEGPQFVYDEYDDWTEEYVRMYMLPMKKEVDESGFATYVAVDDMKYVLRKTDSGYEAADPEILLGLAAYGELADIDGNPTGETGYAWLGYGDLDIKFVEREGSNGVTPPDEAVMDKWVFQDPYEMDFVNVAFYGDEIYIQGLDRGVAGAWVRGKVSDGKVTIPSGSYLGINPDIVYFSYLWGSKLEHGDDGEIISGSPTAEVVFDYDAEGKKLTLMDGYAICSMPEDYYLLTLYENVSIARQNRNVDTPPAKPYELSVAPFDEYFEAGIISFYIPNVDEDGNLLDVDKLFYRIYINDEAFTFTPDEYPYLGIGEDMVNVPYRLYDNWDIFVSGEYHDVFFHFELPEEGCGVQAVYINEEGKELVSKIVSSGDSGVDLLDTAVEETSRAYYNMQGQRVDEAYEGPVVCRIVYNDGTVRTVKRIHTTR